MKPVYGPVPSLISFIISQLKINSMTYAQYMTPYHSIKLDIVFLVTMATMYTRGSVRVVKTLLNYADGPGPIRVWVVMLVMVVCDSRFDII